MIRALSILLLCLSTQAGRVAFPGYDAQVIDWNNRANTNNSATPNSSTIKPSTRLAATEFMRDIRNAGLYPGILLRVNLFAGNDFHNGISDAILGAVQTPLIADKGSSIDVTAQAQGSFTYAEQGASAGLSGVGSCALQTGFVASTDLASATNVHFAIYTENDEGASTTWAMGAQDGSGNDWGLIGPDFTAVGTRGDIWVPGLAFSDSGGKGFYLVQHESGNLVTYKAGVQKATSVAAGTRTSVDMWICSLNLNGSRSSSSVKRMAGYSLGLTLPNQLVYYNIWQRFQTCLNRQQ